MFGQKVQRVESKEYDDEGFGLHFRFQPLYAPREERVFGYECLLRLNDPVYGELTPDAFLGYVKKTPGLMIRLEDWALGELVQASRELNKQGIKFEMLSLNMELANLYDEQYLDRMVRLLGDNYDNGNIWLEFKPGILTAGTTVLDNLTDLRALGLKVVLDSFSVEPPGETLPVDMIKIDKGLIASFLTDREAERKILKIISYARARKIFVVAMGVENIRQEKRLLAMGVDKMQGYYYSRPLLLANGERIADGQKVVRTLTETQAISVVEDALRHEKMRKRGADTVDSVLSRMESDAKLIVKRNVVYEVPVEAIEAVEQEAVKAEVKNAATNPSEEKFSAATAERDVWRLAASAFFKK